MAIEISPEELLHCVLVNDPVMTMALDSTMFAVVVAIQELASVTVTE